MRRPPRRTVRVNHIVGRNAASGSKFNSCYARGQRELPASVKTLCRLDHRDLSKSGSAKYICPKACNRFAATYTEVKLHILGQDDTKILHEVWATEILQKRAVLSCPASCTCLVTCHRILATPTAIKMHRLGQGDTKIFCAFCGRITATVLC